MKQAFSCRRLFKIITLTLFLSSLYIWCTVNVCRNNVTAEIIYWIFSTGKLGWRPVSSQRLATCSCVPIRAVMMFLVHFGESFNLFKVKKYDFDPGLLQCCEVQPIPPAPWLPSWWHSSGYPFYLNGNECKTDDSATAYVGSSAPLAPIPYPNRPASREFLAVPKQFIFALFSTFAMDLLKNYWMDFVVWRLILKIKKIL